MQNNKKYPKFKIFFLLFIFIIIFIIGYQILGAAKFETIIASQGEIVDGFWANSVVVRDEKVFKAPISGRADLVEDEGDRIAVGEKVAEINSNNDKKSIYNNKAGILSFAVDGLENEINSRGISQIDLNKIDDYKANYKHRITGRNIKEGEALYRIINNFEFYLIVPASKAQAERFQTNEIVFVQGKNSQAMLRARIIDIRADNEDNHYLFVKLDFFVPRWINVRRVNIKLIKNIYRGITIPRKAIFNQPSGQGVLKVSGYNEYKFQEITIIDSNQEAAVVEGIEIGDKIITNPEDFDYGREG
ncbi:HlyD family efflux transporter periplasmic adaptor subunit [Halanaerobium hydrogeniformans]|uniref:Membrane fusion protein n=1 Tax=Halanaerobium hydrogeniformans TaxID=656519 RepID=E4RLW0_HALHG|nr:HlyD family efflux transporter periplasmic adaptor subunit [Halanaerobium hydrogeniformans]ADQ15024.1 putative membrane fusion protein [Halanaerobium hydrogeniformans]